MAVRVIRRRVLVEDTRHMLERATVVGVDLAFRRYLGGGTNYLEMVWDDVCCDKRVSRRGRRVFGLPQVRQSGSTSFFFTFFFKAVTAVTFPLSYS